jgi:phage gp16-like protein
MTTPRAQAQAAALERRRKAGVQAIKAAQRQLGLDDDTYRSMLERFSRPGPGLPGKRSATLLTLQEQAAVLDHLRAAGATNPKRAGRDGGKRRPVPAADRAELMAKVHSLLDGLGRATGEPHSLAYADAICKRNGWADAVNFCNAPTLHKLVGALSRTLRARQSKAQEVQA